MGSHRVGHDWSDLAAAAAGTMIAVVVLPIIEYFNGAFFPSFFL